MPEALMCRYCGGYNLSIDFETGLSTCNDCPSNKTEPHKAKKIDLDEMRQAHIERTEEEIMRLKKSGVDIKLNTNINKKKGI